jgi:predicted RNase H-like HicB family nuclease
MLEACVSQVDKVIRSPGYILLTFKVHEEDGLYVSECEELQVASFGDTIEEAFNALEDAVIVYLNALDDEGDRERVFAERGIEIIPGQPELNGEAVPVLARPHEYVSPHPMRIPTGAQ